MTALQALSPDPWHPRAASERALQTRPSRDAPDRDTLKTTAPAPASGAAPRPPTADALNAPTVLPHVPTRPAKVPRQGIGAWLGAKMGLGGAAPARPYVGRWALVTGASSGIGACFAEELARRGAHLILAARSETKLQGLAERLRADHAARAEVFVTDLSVPDAGPALLGRIRARGLRVDVLVNNAGIGAYGPSESVDRQRQRDMLQVNVVATTELALGCLPAMQARKEGTIFNIASIAAFAPMPNLTSYAATKAYVRNFSEGLWAEKANRDNNVRILAVCPGATETPFFDGAGMGNPEAALGALSTPQSVIDASFGAVDKDRSYVICNTADYLKMQAIRLAPRAAVVTVLEQRLRPDAHAVKKSDGAV